MTPARQGSVLDLLRRLDPRQTVQEALESQAQAPRLQACLRKERRRLEAMSLLEGLPVEPGAGTVAGADEVGRGPMAGPLVAAAVSFRSIPWLPGLRDSKKLKPEEREALVPWIQAQAESWAIRVVPVEDLNAPEGTIHSHSLAAMRHCVLRLVPSPKRLLVDGCFPLPDLDIPQQAVVHGDNLCLTVAAASVLAKVHRDRLMTEMDVVWPGYGFAGHKGYCTPDHREALERLGPCPEHRTRFEPVRARASRNVQGLLELQDFAADGR